MTSIQSYALATPQMPCDGLDRHISLARASKLAPINARQLKTPTAREPNTLQARSVKVLQYFGFKDWRIIYVSTGASDELFLFYSGAPEATHFLAASGGANGYDHSLPQAASEAVKGVRSWLVGKAPGIPARLAACWAWHVTLDRDQ